MLVGMQNGYRPFGKQFQQFLINTYSHMIQDPVLCNYLRDAKTCGHVMAYSDVYSSLFVTKKNLVTICELFVAVTEYQR